ncbi:MAG: hypothetical protein DPW14_14885 [Planctomycetes bacterium]|nr:hypothetical protein [Planctomycetota bacterium]
MSGTWPKVIRDPIHGIIPFEDTPCDRLLLELINTREFQRLRRVKQLGMSELVFPGANHSRFAHSIGVMHTARLFLNTVVRKGHKLDDDQRLTVLAAALLHDVGHGPFSHAFESVTKDHHEARTRAVISDPATEVNKRLVGFNKELPTRIDMFFDEGADEEGLEKAGVPPYLVHVVSSQLDADRSDYLLRDSHATGADYGHFDLEWLIRHLEIDDKKKRFFVAKKAFASIEQYVFCRYHMYRSVYYHKTTRAAEVMLKLIFQRYRDLLKNGNALELSQQFAPETPKHIVTAFAGKMLDLQTYLSLDDFAITEFFKCCTRGNDKTLTELALGLLDRKLYKAVDATDSDLADVGNFTMEAGKVVESACKEQGSEQDYVFFNDSAANSPYKFYNPDAEKQEAQIFIEDAASKVVELSEISDAVKALKKFKLTRYYFPEALREKIDPLAQKFLRKAKS